MNRILAILFLLLPLVVKGQTYPPQKQGAKLYKFMNGLGVDSALFLPSRDTSVTDPTMKAPGMLLYRSLDSLLYYMKGNTMTPLASGKINDSASLNVENISTLRTTPRNAVPDRKIVFVRGYYAAGDGGGGNFYWDATSTDADNGGTIIKVTSVTTGRWKRIITGDVDFRMFGARGDSLSNDSDPVQRAIDAFQQPGITNSGAHFTFSKGRYLLANVVIKSGTYIDAYQAARDNFIPNVPVTIAAYGNPDYIFDTDPDATNWSIRNLSIDGDYTNQPQLKAAVRLRGQKGYFTGNNVNRCAQVAVWSEAGIVFIEKNGVYGWYGSAPTFTGTNDFRGALHVPSFGDAYITKNEIGAGLSYFTSTVTPRDAVNGRIVALSLGSTFGGTGWVSENYFENGDKAVAIGNSLYCEFYFNRYELSALGGLHIYGPAQYLGFTGERFADNSLTTNGGADNIIIGIGAAGHVVFDNPTFERLVNGAIPNSGFKSRWGISNFGSVEIDMNTPKIDTSYISGLVNNVDVAALPVRQVVGQYDPVNPVYNSVTAGGVGNRNPWSNPVDTTGSVKLLPGTTFNGGDYTGSINLIKSRGAQHSSIGFNNTDDLTFLLYGSNGRYVFGNGEGLFAKNGASGITIQSNDGLGDPHINMQTGTKVAGTTLDHTTGDINSIASGGFTLTTGNGSPFTYIGGNGTFAKAGGLNLSLISDNTGTSLFKLSSDVIDTRAYKISFNNAIGDATVTATGNINIGLTNNWRYAANGINYIPKVPNPATVDTTFDFLVRTHSDGEMKYRANSYWDSTKIKSWGAPASGGSGYIQNQVASPQSAGYYISGNSNARNYYAHDNSFPGTDTNFVAALEGIDNINNVTYSIGDINATNIIRLLTEPLKANNVSINAFKNQDIGFAIDSFSAGTPYKVRMILKKYGHLYLRDIDNVDSAINNIYPAVPNPYKGNYIYSFNNNIFSRDTTGAIHTLSAGYIMPEHYGAKGDGITDDGPAFQAAFNSGKPVYVGPKTYIINTTTIVPEGAYVFGQRGKSIIKTTTNQVVFDVQGNYVTIKDLKFLGDGKATGKTVQRAISMISQRVKTLIDGCIFSQLGGMGIYMNSIGNYKGNIISNCIADSCYAGYFFDNQAEYNSLIGCFGYGNTYGVVNYGGNNSITDGSYSQNDTAIVMGFGTGNPGHCTITGARINHNFGASLVARGVTIGHTINGSMFYDGKIIIDGCTGFKFVGCDFSVDSITVKNSSVGCYFTNNRIRGLDPVLNFDNTSQVYWNGNYNEVTTNQAPANLTITTTTTLAPGNLNVYAAASSNIVINLPPAALCAGKEYYIKKIINNVNSITIDPNGAETIDGAATLVFSTFLGFYRIVSTGGAWSIMANDALSAETYTTGTSGTDFNITRSGGTATFNLPDASGTARGPVTTGTQTFAGQKTFSSGILLTTVTNDLYLPTLSSLSAITNIAYTFGGANTVYGRVMMGGSTATTLGVNSSFGNALLGKATFTTGASGTHGYGANLVAMPMVKSGGTAAVTYLANILALGAPTGGTNNYNLLTDSGTVALNPTSGNVAIGKTSATSVLDVGGSMGVAITTITATTTLDASHHTVLVNNSSNIAVNLPAAASCPTRIYVIKKISNNANTVTITGSGAELIDATNTQVLSAQWASFTIQSNGTQWYIQ